MSDLHPRRPPLRRRRSAPLSIRVALIAGAIPNIAPPDPLRAAALRGWNSSSRALALRMGNELAKILRNKESLAEVCVVDGVTGRILANSAGEPFGRAADASWIGDSANVRIDREGRCVIGYPFASPDGARLALILYVRLDVLFAQVRTRRMDEILGLDFAILDGDSRVLVSSDPSHFPPGEPSLPIASLRELRSGVIRQVSDKLGEPIIADLLGAEAQGLAHLQLFISSRLSKIQKTIVADRNAAMEIVITATLRCSPTRWTT